MSLDTVQDGEPVYLFEFFQDRQVYRYTTAATMIADSAGAWTPAAITASAVQQSGELAKNGIKVTLPRNFDLAQQFLGRVPEAATTLTVSRGPAGQPYSEYAVQWKGRVASASASHDEVVLDCEDVFTSMRRPGLRARYQKGCRHALYSPPCGVSRAQYAVDATINSVRGFAVAITIRPDSHIDSNSSVFADDYFTGGILELADGAARHVLTHTALTAGASLTLLSPFSARVTAGAAATVYPGCQHNTQDCRHKFNNLNNYGGFPYIPGKNPFANSVGGSIV